MTAPVSPQKLRPWYLVLALSLTALVGLFGSTSGCSTVSYLRGSHELPVLLEQGGADDLPAWVRSGVVRERARLGALAERHRVAFPLSVAKLLLGTLLLVASASALSGRRGARTFLLQVLAANAVLAIVDWTLMAPVRDAMAWAVASDGLDHGLALAELSRDENLQMFRSVVLWGERIRFAVLELGVFGGAAIALTRQRARQFYAAMAKLADQAENDGVSAAAVTAMPAHAPRIAVLPPLVANQIAAGEVVTRPASVAKELLENALDAEATRIQVDVEAGGSRLLRVTDDGHGMDEADARLCVQRHATSKIRSADDLLAISSLGFRGEALPSIASVSRFLLRTRRAADELGTELRIDGSDQPTVCPCGCAPGTSVEVSELFFNVPARRKFLRALSTESAHVTEVVAAAALAHPHVTFVLVRDGRTARQWLRAAERAERVADVLDAPGLIRCAGSRGPLELEAFLAPPEQGRVGAAGLRLFVGGRPVQDRALARAVATAFGEALAPGRYPVGALFLALPAELVDVNVHPQKAEIRFAHARAVADAVYSILQAELVRTMGLPAHGRAFAPAAAAGLRASPTSGSPAAEPGPWAWSGASALPSPRRVDDAAQPGRGTGPAEPRRARDEVPARAPHRSLVRWLGRAQGRWLLFEDDAGLLVLDEQRAAQLRARGEARSELRTGTVAASRLLFPCLLRVDQPTWQAVERATAWLDRSGFDLRAAGPDEVALHAVPRCFGAVHADALVRSLAETLRQRADGGEQDLALLEAACQHVAVEGARTDADDAGSRAHELLTTLRSLATDGDADAASLLTPIPWTELASRGQER